MQFEQINPLGVILSGFTYDAGLRRYTSEESDAIYARFFGAEGIPLGLDSRCCECWPVEPLLRNSQYEMLHWCYVATRDVW